MCFRGQFHCAPARHCHRPWPWPSSSDTPSTARAGVAKQRIAQQIAPASFLFIFFPYHSAMAQYVYTMRRVEKVVPPKRAILKNISLNFFPGAKIGVLGLNGSGKSSLLKIMAGVDDNYEGEVIRMPGIRVGFLEQEPSLNKNQTVRQVVEESMGDVAAAKKRLEEIYAAYSEPDADFDK